MKKVIFAAILLGVVSSQAFAGFFDDAKKVDNPNQPIEVILNVPGNTKSQLFSTVKSWLGEIQILANMDADKDSGRIVGTAATDTSLGKEAFSLRVDTKDGKVKMTFTNFYFRPLQQSAHGIYDQHDLNEAHEIAKFWSDKFLEYANQQSATKQW